MPRGKKSKKDEDQDIEDVENNEDVEELELENKKKSSRSSKSSKSSGSSKLSKSSKSSRSSKTKKSKKTDNNTGDAGEDEEDELSDLDVHDDDMPAETNDQDEIVTFKPERPPIKIIDPKSQIGKLKPEEILNYLIQYGTENTNPTLKVGAIILLKKITGKYRRPNNNGSKRNGPPRGFPRGGGRGGGGRGFNPRNQQRGQVPPQENLYDDN